MSEGKKERKSREKRKERNTPFGIRSKKKQKKKTE